MAWIGLPYRVTVDPEAQLTFVWFPGAKVAAVYDAVSGALVSELVEQQDVRVAQVLMQAPNGTMVRMRWRIIRHDAQHVRTETFAAWVQNEDLPPEIRG